MHGESVQIEGDMFGSNLEWKSIIRENLSRWIKINKCLN